MDQIHEKDGWNIELTSSNIAIFRGENEHLPWSVSQLRQSERSFSSKNSCPSWAASSGINCTIASLQYNGAIFIPYYITFILFFFVIFCMKWSASSNKKRHVL